MNTWAISSPVASIRGGKPVVGVVYSSNSDNYSPTRRQHGLTT